MELNFSHLKTLKYSYLNSSLFGATNNMQSASNIGVNSSVGGGSGVGVASPTSANTNQSYSFGTQTKPSILLQQPQQQQQQTKFATQFSTMPINLAVLNNLTSSNTNINNISSSVGGGSVNTLPMLSIQKRAKS